MYQVTVEAIPQITSEDKIPRRAQTDSTAFSVILGDLKIIVGRCYPNPCQRGPFLPMLVYSSNGGSSLYSFLVSEVRQLCRPAKRTAATTYN